MVLLRNRSMQCSLSLEVNSKCYLEIVQVCNFTVFDESLTTSFPLRRTKVGSDVPVVIADDAPASVHR